MPRKFCLIIILLLQTASSAQAYEIAAVISSRAKPYTLALQAFQQHFNKLCPSRGLKSIQPDTITVFRLDKKVNSTQISQKIRAAKPDLIIAFGSKALSLAAKGARNTPIIYLLVPSPENFLTGNGQATGVLLQPEPGVEFQALTPLFPAVNRIGVVYDPDKSTDLISATMAMNRDLSFVLRPVGQAREVAGALHGLAEKVDLVWMLPDTTSLTPQSEKSYYLFSLQHKIPLLAFSEKYLKRGATFSVSLDLAEMGKKAAELAKRIKNGERPSTISPIRIDQVRLKTNQLIVNKLGLKVKGAGQ